MKGKDGFVMYKVRVQRLFNLGSQIQFYCRDRDAANEQMMWLQNVRKSGEKLTKKETSELLMEPAPSWAISELFRKTELLLDCQLFFKQQQKAKSVLARSDFPYT